MRNRICLFALIGVGLFVHNSLAWAQCSIEKPNTITSDAHINPPIKILDSYYGGHDLFEKDGHLIVLSGDPHSLDIFPITNTTTISANDKVSIMSPSSDFSTPYSNGDIDGDRFYALANDGRLHTYDITDPALVSYLGEVGQGGNDLIAESNYVYISRSGANHLDILDVSNPAAMVLVGSVSASGDAPQKITKNGNYIYANSNGGLKVYDVTSVNSPTLVTSIVFDGTDCGIDLVNNSLMCGLRLPFTGGGDIDTFMVHSYDISVPTSPSIVSQTQVSGLPLDIRGYQGDHAYVSCDHSGDCAKGSITVIDASILATPQIVGEGAPTCSKFVRLLPHYGRVYAVEPYTAVDPNQGLHIWSYRLNHNDGLDTRTECDSLTWFDGVKYTSSTSEQEAFIDDSQGCDSTVTLGLTMNHSSSSTDEVSNFGPYTWINGMTYNESVDTITHTITNSVGCDSVITLDLTVTKNDQTITVDGTHPRYCTVGEVCTFAATSTSGLVVEVDSIEDGFGPSNPARFEYLGNHQYQINEYTVLDVYLSVGGDATYNSANGNFQIRVNKGDQTINFFALDTVNFLSPAFPLNSSINSGLAITWSSSDLSIASITNDSVFIHDVGAVTITASQAGDDSWNAATPVQQTLVIEKANQTLTYTPTTGKKFGDAPFVEMATSVETTEQITYTSADTTIIKITNGNTFNIVGAGSVDITAKVDSNAQYNSAEVTMTMIIGKSDAVTMLTPFDRVPYNVGTVTPVVDQHTSGGTLTYVSSNPTVASVSGNTITVHQTGTTDITVTTAENDDYLAAPDFVQTLQVMDLALQGSTTDLTIPIQGVSWDIQSLQIDPAEFNRFESFNLPSGLSIQGTQLVADGMWSGTHTFNVQAISNSEQILVQRDFTFDLPDIDITGIFTKMYTDQTYNLDLVTLQAVTNPIWRVDGAQVGTNFELSTTFTAGSHDLELIVGYGGNTYTITRTINVIDVVFDVIVPTEPIVLNAPGTFEFSVPTNFSALFGFVPDKITWDFQNGSPILEGTEIAPYRAMAGTYNTKVTVHHGAYTFEKLVSYTVHPEPSLVIPSINGDAGSSVNTTVQVNNMEVFGPSVRYEIIGCPVDGISFDSASKTITGTLDWAGHATCELAAYAPSGNKIVSQNFQTYGAPSVQLFIPNESNVVVDNFFAIQAITNISARQVDRYEWVINGPSSQSWPYNVQNPHVRFVEPGQYSVSLDTYLTTGEHFSRNRNFTVHNNPNFVLETPYDIPNFNARREQKMLFAINGTGEFGGSSFSLFEAPENCTINSQTGVLSWTPFNEGNYQFEVRAFNPNTGVVTKLPVNIQVQPPSGSAKFQVRNQVGVPLANINLKVELNYEIGQNEFHETKKQTLANAKTDGNGYVLYNVGNEVLEEFEYFGGDRCQVFLSSENNEPANYTYEGFVNGDNVLEYNADIEIQGFKLQADQISYDPISMLYTFTNLVIHGQILVEGQSTISGTPGNFATLKTFGWIKYVGANEYLNNSHIEKEYWLSKGMIAASEQRLTRFQLGKFAGIEQEGIALSISKGMDSVTTYAFPKLPWIVGEVIDGFTQEAVRNTRKIMANPYGFPTAFQLGRGAIGLLMKTQREKLEFPKIEIMQTRTQGQSKWDFIMQNLTFSMPNKLGVEELTFIYKESEDYLQVGGKINFPSGDGKKSRSVLSKVDRDGYASLSTSEFDETFARAAKSDFQEPLIQTQYGEVADLSSSVRSSAGATRSLPINGLGMAFAVKQGKIDSVVIRAGTEIKFPQYGIQINELFGGLSDLTKDNPDGSVSYNPNFSIFAGCELADIATQKFKAEDAHIKLTLFNSLSGSAKFTLFNFELGKGSFIFNRSPLNFKAKASTNVFAGFFKGYMAFSAGYDTKRKFDMAGAGKLSVGLPVVSVIPKPFRGLRLGSFQAGFNRETIGAKVSIGLETVTRSQREPSPVTRAIFICDWIEVTTQATQHVANGVAAASGTKPVDVRATIGNTVVKIADEYKHLLNVTLGVGYDFKNGQVLWGKNVKIPEVRRRHTRGDTVEYVFDVGTDVERIYLMMDNGGVDVVDFDVYGPGGNKLVENIEHLEIIDDKTSFSHIWFPDPGTYTVKVDTAQYGEVNYDFMLMNPQPTGVFTAPLTTDTNSTQIAMKFNDLNDTLDVRVYVDENNSGFDGAEISQFKILNNANVKFDYEPEKLLPGDYYFYYILTDPSGLPVAQYAPGKIHITGNESAPELNNLTTSITGDSLVVSWDELADDVEYVKLRLINLTKDLMEEKDQTGDTTQFFSRLEPGSTYELLVYTIDDDFEYSEPLKISNIQLTLPAGQNPPMMVSYPNEPFEFQEGRFDKIALTAQDADGDTVTYTMLENFPKSMIMRDDSLFWAPELGDAGLHSFHLVISDGIHHDTIPLTFDVSALGYEPVEISLGKQYLHESENMSIDVRNDTLDAQSVEVLLGNYNKDQMITLTANSVGNNHFIANFDLSTVMTSDLDVDEGDTIVASYLIDDLAFITFARFVASPQIQDHTPPGAVTDLAVSEHNQDSLMLIFTVPSDSLDNGTLVKPWVYDLRFDGQTIDSEALFADASFFDYYDTKPFGQKDTVYLEKALIPNFESSPEIWFNLKTADGQFNYSMMSNSVAYTQVVPAVDVVATLTDHNVITVDWEGTTDTSINHFESYVIYRSNNEDTLEYQGEVFTNSFVDSLRVGVNNGKVQYSVIAHYSGERTEGVLSNVVLVDLYSDVQVRVLELDSGATVDIDGLAVTLAHNVDSLSLSSTTNAFGYAFFPHTWNDDYTIEVMFGNEMIVEEDTSIRIDKNSFEFLITIPDTTAIGLDELADAGIQIVPNPTSGEFFIRGNGIGDVAILSIKLMNASGQNLASSNFVANSSNEIYCNVSELRAGVYLLTIPMNDKLITRKVYVR